MSDPTVTLGPAVDKDDHVRGSDHADVTLMVYGDYECPYTRKAYRIVQRLERRLGERLRFVFRHFPLVEIHPHAQPAAEAAEAASDQGHFWEMHDLLFRRQRALEHEDLRRYASELGLDAVRFGREVADRVHAPRINRDVVSGVGIGVRGTPTLFIDGRRYDGSYESEVLGPALERAAEQSRSER